MTEKDKYQKATQLISELCDRFHYRPVPMTLEFGDVRKTFKELLPAWCKENGDVITLRTMRGTPIMQGYDRIVIGDYGAFLETTPDKMMRKYIRIKDGQEFRMNDPQFSNCKYIWMTATDDSDVKIYFQKHSVSYADYIPGRIYVSPYEVKI